MLLPRIDLHAMTLILDGLDPVGRRVLLLLPRGDEPVGMRVSTVVTSIERVGLECIMTVKPFTDMYCNESIRRLRFSLVEKSTAVEVATIEAPKNKGEQMEKTTMWVKCYTLLDTLDAASVADAFTFYGMKCPNAWSVFVE